jgi:hypothetical protein
MASPQVAGAGALLTQLHPTWSPAQMRSALATTARPVTDGAGPASPLAAGGGRIDPAAAGDPGLVIAPTAADYRAFADGTLEGRDLNMPSIQLGLLEGETSVTRTVTSVGATRAGWTASVQGARVPGLDVRVSPARFTIAPGQSQALQISVMTAQGAPQPQAQSVVLRNDQNGRTVTIPVAVKNPGIDDPPAIIDVPAPGPDGEQPLTATVNGTVHPTGFGLVAPQVLAGLQTEAGPNPGEQGYTLPITLTKETQLLAAKATSHDAAAPPFLTRIYRDVDGDGRWGPVKYGDMVSLPIDWSGVFDEADAFRLPAGSYFVLVNPIDFYYEPIPFDLRIWTVDDPRPDDPQPAPGLAIDGDVEYVSPAQQHTFGLHYTGAGGSESLRGMIEWDGAGDANVLARSIVRVDPPSGG